MSTLVKGKKRSLEAKQRRYGYLFTLPFIIGAIIFVLYPMVTSVLYSLSSVKFDHTVGSLALTDWGFGQYNQIWAVDVSFRDNLLQSLGKMVVNVPVVVIFAFFMASVLNTKFIGRGVSRSIMFLPVIISAGIVVALSSNDMASSLISSGDRFAATAGEGFEVTTAFQEMLESMELSQWLVDFIVNAVSNITEIVNLSAVSIVIFLAGLQSISPSIYEASYIEGATKWEVFWKISLPMVSPLILLSVVYTIVDAFNGENNVVIASIHQKVVGTDYSIASAMAVSYSLIILVILVAVFALLSKLVFYQD